MTASGEKPAHRVAPWQQSGLPMSDNDRGKDWVRDREIECASREEVDQLCARAWETQRAYVADHSRYFDKAMTAAGIDLRRIQLHDLADLPMTTKKELQQTQAEAPPFGDHLAASPESIKRIYQTSGTTGQPSMIALTRADIGTWRQVGARTYQATGIRDHNAVLTTFGAGPFVAGHTHAVLEELGPRAVPVAPGDTPRIVNALKLGLVDTMLSTPSFAMYLANHLEQSGVDASKLGLIHLVVGGEPGGGMPTFRARIESVFDAEVTEAMGLGDISPSIFGECLAKQGMHFCGQGLVWPELIDEKGQSVPLEQGATGELVYTHLRREAMPLVRFRSGDWVTVLTTDCPCGRTSFTIRVMGRVDDMFIVRGVNVYPSAVQAIVGEFMPAVTGRVRIVMPASGTIVTPPVPIEVEVPDSDSNDSALAQRMAQTIRDRLNFRAEVLLLGRQNFGSAEYKTRPVRREP